MLIREGSAEELYNWFLTEHTPETILCLFLASNNRQIDELALLIESVVEVDTILGPKIGFLICSGDNGKATEINLGYGERLIVGARYHSANHERQDQLRTYMQTFDPHSGRASGDTSYYREKIKALARSSSRLTPDFMEMLGIKHEELPSIIILYKGLPDYSIVPCSQSISKNEIVSGLSSVRKIVEEVEREIIYKDMSEIMLWLSLCKSSEYQMEIAAKIKKVRYAVIGICGSHDIDALCAVTLNGGLCSEILALDRKIDLVKAFVERFPGSANDNRWDKIDRLLRRIDQVQQLNADRLSILQRKNIEIQVRDEIQKLQMIQDKIRGLSFGGKFSRYGIKYPSRREVEPWRVMERVNTSTDIMAKLSRVLSLIV